MTFTKLTEWSHHWQDLVLETSIIWRTNTQQSTRKATCLSPSSRVVCLQMPLYERSTKLPWLLSYREGVELRSLPPCTQIKPWYRPRSPGWTPQPPCQLSGKSLGAPGPPPVCRARSVRLTSPLTPLLFGKPGGN